MDNTRLRFLFALLQAMSLLSTSPTIHGVSDAAASCHASGYVYLQGNETGCPGCCVAGERYPRFRCSPPVSARTTTPAILTLKVFDHGEDGGVDPHVLRHALPPEHGAGGRAVLRVAAPRRRRPPLPPEDPRLRRRRRGERTVVRGRQGGGRLRLRERVPRGGRVRAAVPEQRRRRVAGGVGEAWAQRERGRIRSCVVLSEER